MISPTAPSLQNVTFASGFLGERIAVVHKTMLPYQWEALNDRIAGAERSGCMSNLRIAAGLETGEFHGMFWQDSDLYKWIEAVAYRLATHPDENLQVEVTTVIELLAKAQQPDGYINTYFQLVDPDARFTNLRDCHELYCAGHLIEAAVAWNEATGRTDLLDIACRFADLLVATFGTGEGQYPGYPGHEEVELALVKLARATNNDSYLELASRFIEQRGSAPLYFEIEAKNRGDASEPPYMHHDRYAYWQAHLPVREHTDPVGHCVRAMYLYCAMADLARDRSDNQLAGQCETLWDAIVQRHLYVTGGIGADGPGGEKFSAGYDLPSDRAYAETCAGVGLVMFARRMLDLRLDSKFSDIMELALYNNVLAGMSLDGMSFFYVNPLEVRPDEARRRFDQRHAKTRRQPWFGCACCPPNVARLLSSLGEYAFSMNPGRVAVHLYVDCDIDTTDPSIGLKVRTGIPWNGSVEATVTRSSGEAIELAFRIPEWCSEPTFTLNSSDPIGVSDALPVVEDGCTVRFSNGYLRITKAWTGGDCIRFQFAMKPKRLKSHPAVAATSGCVALQRGPMVYCFESVDNGENLHALSIPGDASIEAKFEADLLSGCTILSIDAVRDSAADSESELYRTSPFMRKPVTIRAIPYALWCNRGENEMRVWIRESG